MPTWQKNKIKKVLWLRLSDLKPGESGVIVSIDVSNKDFSNHVRRLEELGFVRGNSVSVQHVIFDVIVVSCTNTSIAIGKNLAALVRVEVLKN